MTQDSEQQVVEQQQEQPMKVLVDYPAYTPEQVQDRNERIIRSLVCNGDHVTGFGLQVSTLTNPSNGELRLVIELSGRPENVTSSNLRDAFRRLIKRLKNWECYSA